MASKKESAARGKLRRSAPMKAGRQRRKQKRQSVSTAAFIDQLLLSPISITQNGATSKERAVAVIMLQLFKNEQEGDAKASRVFRKYRQLVSRAGEPRPHLVFVETDRSPSGLNPKAQCSDG